MSIRRLPSIENLERSSDDEDDGIVGDREFREWSNKVAFRLADAPAGTVIDILSPIGRNPFTGEGVNAQDVARALRGVTGEVTVNINSPGGSYFEGLSIYTLLKNHPAKVTVNIIGTAASAASLIAMAGDLIRVSIAGSIMIHNAMASVDGNRHDMEDGAAALEQIDSALRTVYSARTGQTDGALDRMMTPTIGTWLFGQDAIDKGFADELIATDKLIEDKKAAKSAPSRARTARAQFDAVAARAGMPRSQRRELWREMFSDTSGIQPSNVDNSAPYAEIAKSIRDLTKS